MKKNLRIRVVWLYGMIAIVILLCCIFLFYSLFIFKNIRNKEIFENTNNAANIQEVLDDTWDSILVHALPLVNSSISNRLEPARNFRDFQSQDAQALFLDMRNTVIFDSTMKDITLYYPNADYIVGSMGIKNSRAYWSLTYGVNQNISYEQWKTRLYCHGNSGFFTIEGTNESELYYRFCFGGASNRILVIRISREAIVQQLQLLQSDSSNSYAAVLTGGDEIYAYCGYADAITYENGVIVPSNDSYFCTRLPSKIDGVEYLSLGKKSAIFHLSSTSLTIAAILLTMSILACFFMIRWILKRHIQPIENMAAKVSRGHKHKNELQIINAAFEDLLTEQHSLEELYDQQQMIIARTFMDELLRNDLVEQKNPEDVAAAFGYSFENSHYCIMAKSCSASDTEKETAALVKDQNEFSDGSVLIWWTRKHNVDFFLVNYDDCNKSVLASLQNSLAVLSSPTAKIVCSQQSETPRAILEMYQQCCEGLGCSHLFRPAASDAAANNADNTNPVFEQFQQLIIGGNIPDAQKIAKNLFEQFVQDNDNLLFNTKNYLIIHFLLPYTPTNTNALLAQLPLTHDCQQWVTLLKSILDSCTFMLDTHSQLSENDIAARIRKLIHRQYNNPLLDLHMLSSQMNLSQSYISHLFKLKYNVSVAQYINSVRIKKAKELILLGNDSIKAISIKVGFSGDSQFIRAYKRIEGVTPGNFRTANSQAQSSGGNE